MTQKQVAEKWAVTPAQGDLSPLPRAAYPLSLRPKCARSFLQLSTKKTQKTKAMCRKTQSQAIVKVVKSKHNEGHERPRESINANVGRIRRRRPVSPFIRPSVRQVKLSPDYENTRSMRCVPRKQCLHRGRPSLTDRPVPSRTTLTCWLPWSASRAFVAVFSVFSRIAVN